MDNLSECIKEYQRLRNSITREDVEEVEEKIGEKLSRPWSEISMNKKIDLALVNKFTGKELKELCDKFMKNSRNQKYMPGLHDLKNNIFILRHLTGEDKYKILFSDSDQN
jgi:hypothetical protein